MFKPIIGVRYKYNFYDTICFTLFINYRDFYLPISSHVISSPLKLSLVKNNPNYKPNRLVELEDHVLRQVHSKFELDYNTFEDIYNRSSRMNLNVDDFVPIMLDIWNINRSVSSIKNDVNLRRQLIRRFRRSNSFKASHFRISTYRSILQCLIEEKEYIPGNRSKPALSVSEQYIKCLSIFNSTPRDLNDYVIEQKNKYDELIRENLF